MVVNVKYIEGFNTTVTVLEPETEYEFRILSCANKNDKSVWTPFRFTNVELPNGVGDINGTEMYDGPPKPPEHLNLSFLNRTSVNLTWTDDSGSTLYVVCFVEASKGCDQNTCKDDHKLKR